MLRNNQFANSLFKLLLSTLVLLYVTWLLRLPANYLAFLIIPATRIIVSFFWYNDSILSWTKASSIAAFIKVLMNSFAFCIYSIILLNLESTGFRVLFTDLVFYTFLELTIIYTYRYWKYIKSRDKKSAIIYGAGESGILLRNKLRGRGYKVSWFVDDSKRAQRTSIDGTRILSLKQSQERLKGMPKKDMLVIAIPRLSRSRVKNRMVRLKPYFKQIKILPSKSILVENESWAKGLKEVSVEELLTRRPKDLDMDQIKNFISGKTILITGACGSIGSELVRQCAKFNAKKLILLDHSEFNIYTLHEEIGANVACYPVMQSVVNKKSLENIFKTFKPEIVLHAAAYKHVPLVEFNQEAAIFNNVIGTQNCIDLSIKHGVEKFVLISTDKAVNPTNVMGATKRICELYAQNSNGRGKTDIVAVRFGNVLGSSGSVIPKFKQQISSGQNLTVTHPDITRYFMLISEACELVLQAASIASGGEVFILDMGKPVKIVDLANKMLELTGRDDLEVEFVGLRPGEKLYEELITSDADKKTQYESIMVGHSTEYDLEKLTHDIEQLLTVDDKIAQLKYIIPEFNHLPHDFKIKL
ncbi:MAG: polysaccharide biosynthesis protein [Fibrobacterales bacterium]